MNMITMAVPHAVSSIILYFSDIW